MQTCHKTINARLFGSPVETLRAALLASATLLLALAACSAIGPAEQSLGLSELQPGLKICVGQPAVGDHLLVDVTVYLDRLDHSGGPLELVLPSGEGPARARVRGLELIAPPGETSPRLGFTQEGRILIHSTDLSHAHFRYEVHPIAERMSADTRHAMVGNRRTLYAPGHALLVQIPNLELAPDAPLIWTTGTDCELGAVSSSIPEGRTSLQRLLDAQFVAGTGWWRSRAPSPAGPVLIFADSWSTAIGRALEAELPALLRAQRALTEGAEDSSVHVVVLSTPPDSPPTGSGRAGGFLLELPQGFDHNQSQLLELLSHENLHRILGHTIHFNGRDHLKTLWFIEGITEFLALHLLASLDSSREQRLLETLAQAADTIDKYHAAHEPGWEEWEALLTRSELARRLPYDQGILIGAWLMSQPGDPLSWPEFLTGLAKLPQPLSEQTLLSELYRWASPHGGDSSWLTPWIEPGGQPDLQALWARLGLARIELRPQQRRAVSLSEAHPSRSDLSHSVQRELLSMSLLSPISLTTRRQHRSHDSKLQPLPASPWRQRLGLER